MAELDIKKKLDAIHKVVEILKEFEPSDVADIIAFALKHVKSEAPAQIPLPSLASTVSSLSNDVNVPIDQFVGTKNPRNEYQRIAVIAYYLMKKGQEIVTAQDIGSANTDARQPRFSNLSSSLNRAITRYKYLTVVRRGEYKLSYDAGKMVETLPNHEEAKKVINSTKKMSRKKKKAELKE